MGKTIVVCCDGTGNEYGANNTNVVDTFSPIVRDANQIAYYDPGIGTFSIFGRVLGKKIGVILGQAFGYGLTENIEDAYTLQLHKNPRESSGNGVEYRVAANLWRCAGRHHQ